MGYSHQYIFYRRPLEIPDGADRFSRAVRLFRTGIKQMTETTYVEWGMEVPLRLCGPDGTGQPILTDDRIAFNGESLIIHDWSHEPLDIQYDQEHCRAFIKTNAKPYDAAVCLALLCFKEAFGDDFGIVSDGEMSKGECGWAHALVVFSQIMK